MGSEHTDDGGCGDTAGNGGGFTEGRPRTRITTEDIRQLFSAVNGWALNGSAVSVERCGGRDAEYLVTIDWASVGDPPQVDFITIPHGLGEVGMTLDLDNSRAVYRVRG